jgi:hypothetical protein
MKISYWSAEIRVFNANLRNSHHILIFIISFAGLLLFLVLAIHATPMDY